MVGTKLMQATFKPSPPAGLLWQPNVDLRGVCRPDGTLQGSDRPVRNRPVTGRSTDSVTAKPAAIIAEQARFLLAELQDLLVVEGLVDNDDVVIVAARVAYGEYLEYSAYICQAERAFKAGLTHMGFYISGAIQVHVPHIHRVEDHVSFTDEEAAARKGGQPEDQLIGQIIERTLAANTREPGQQYQIFLLSGPEDADTVQLTQAITNDTVSAKGRITAWVQDSDIPTSPSSLRPASISQATWQAETNARWATSYRPVARFVAPMALPIGRPANGKLSCTCVPSKAA
jgi:hypothetical protein